MIGLPFLPESPRWLAKVDRTEEAIQVLASIQANGNIEDPYVVAEYEEIMTVLIAERQAPPGWKKFVYNGMWKRTLAGFSVQAWQQLSGANVRSLPQTNYSLQTLTRAIGHDLLRRLYLRNGRA